MDALNGLYIKEYNVKSKKNATVIITHGIAEQSKSFNDVALHLEQNGYNVITYDLRGHGRTMGKKGYVDSYMTMIEDLDFLVDRAFKSTEKVFLYGHSMGGVITNIYATLKKRVNGVIITASPTKIMPVLNMIRIIPRRFINNMKIKTDFNDPRLTHENKYIKDEFDMDYFYMKMVIEVMIKGMKVLTKNMHNYTTPILLIYSESDQMVSPKMGQRMYDKIKSEDKQIKVYKTSYHNIHMDVEVDLLKEDIVNWLDQRI